MCKLITYQTLQISIAQQQNSHKTMEAGQLVTLDSIKLLAVSIQPLLWGRHSRLISSDNRQMYELFWLGTCFGTLNKKQCMFGGSNGTRMIPLIGAFFLLMIFYPASMRRYLRGNESVAMTSYLCCQEL